MTFPPISRRRFAALGAGALAGLGPAARAAGHTAPHVLADMHSHYAMFMRFFVPDLGRHLADNGTTLVAWSLVDDTRWTALTREGYRQQRVPAPGELWAYFESRIADLNARLEQWNLPRALTPADVDAAVNGSVRMVLATEGASFLEGRPERLVTAHAAGVRHLQLVHFIQSPLGDHQTAEPVHGGLTATGAKVVAECGRLGMLVDLAHGTAALVDGVLDAYNGTPVWSHSWISPQGGGWKDPGYIARSLSPASARKIAARGGVVGLWSVRVNAPDYPLNGVRAYADEIMRMADLIGPAHVAFGTDMAGAGPNPVLRTYVDLREVADQLLQRGVGEAVLRGIFIGNYARVLQAAMNSAVA